MKRNDWHIDNDDIVWSKFKKNGVYHTIIADFSFSDEALEHYAGTVKFFKENLRDWQHLIRIDYEKKQLIIDGMAPCDQFLRYLERQDREDPSHIKGNFSAEGRAAVRKKIEKGREFGTVAAQESKRHLSLKDTPDDINHLAVYQFHPDMSSSSNKKSHVEKGDWSFDREKHALIVKFRNHNRPDDRRGAWSPNFNGACNHLIEFFNGIEISGKQPQNPVIKNGVETLSWPHSTNKILFDKNNLTITISGEDVCRAYCNYAYHTYVDSEIPNMLERTGVPHILDAIERDSIPLEKPKISHVERLQSEFSLNDPFDADAKLKPDGSRKR